MSSSTLPSHSDLLVVGVHIPAVWSSIGSDARIHAHPSPSQQRGWPCFEEAGEFLNSFLSGYLSARRASSKDCWWNVGNRHSHVTAGGKAGYWRRFALLQSMPLPFRPRRTNSMQNPSQIHTPGFAHYSVAWSPFHTNRIALASSANFGLVGNGRLHLVSANPGPGGTPVLSLEKL